MPLPESLRSPFIRWIGIAPINAEVVPGHGAIPQHLRPGYKKFEPTPPPEPPRAPFAGNKLDHR